MNLVKIIYLVILIITLIIDGFNFLYAYRRRNTPGAINFMLLLIAIFVYNGAYSLEICAVNLPQALFWYNIEHVAVFLIPYLWLFICLDFTLIFQNIKKQIKKITLIYLFSCYAIFYTNKIHHFFDMSYKFESNAYFHVLISEKGFLYYLLVITSSIIVLLTIVIYIKSCFEVSQLYRNSHIICILASIIPWAAGIYNQTPANTLKIDYYPISLILTAIIFSYGIFRFRIMGTIPIAHKKIFNQVKEGILLIDLNDYIIDSNHSFMKLFPNYNIKSMKSTLTTFLEENTNVYDNLKNASENSFCLTIEGEVHFFSAEIKDISVENNIVGRMLSINDITSFVENQNRLEAAVTQAIKRAETNEIAFLQAQINPHFLNNSLSLISSLITREPKKAKDTIADLGEYLMKCYQFNANDPTQSLKDELDFVETYVAIEKARFMERLKVNIICDEVPTIRVPRLIIQPLVENAIRHGVLKKAQGGTVEIRITQTKEAVFIKISDDGVGIPIDMISKLLNVSTENQGVGIINIHKRLIKYYGKGLTIESMPDNGTSIFFQIPKLVDVS